MDYSAVANETTIFEHALNVFIKDASDSNRKMQKMKYNMECRRKLEERMEQRRLQQETCEFEFNLLNHKK